jgi:hypothetical protein
MESIERLTYILDDLFEIPVIKRRVGLDPIIGLIPGFGELITLMLSTVPIYYALKEGAPLQVILRMLLNTTIDTGIGLIPLLGDAFDFMFKSNRRNLNLFKEWRLNPSHVAKKTTWMFALVLGILFMIMTGFLYLSVLVIKELGMFIHSFF